MPMTLDRRLVAFLTLAAIAIAFVAFTVVSGTWLRHARIDLTEQGLYTLSDGTKSILGKIEEPIRLRFYFSERASVDFPTVRVQAQRVRELLQDFAARSGGKITLTITDPEPFSPAEDEAVAEGLRGAPTQDGRTIYFGLAGTNTVDGREVIPFFSPDRESFVEYDLAALVYRLSQKRKPKIGFASSLPFDTGPGGLMAAMQGQSQPFMIYDQLREVFDITFLEQDFDAVPEDVTTVFLAHPRELDDGTLYALDQFVLRGGKLVLFLDPLSELANLIQSDQAQPANPVANSATHLGPLLRAWGVTIDPANVVGDRKHAVRVVYGQNNETIDYVGWMRLSGDTLAKDDPITAEVPEITLGTPGYITAVEGATTTLRPIVTSSDQAALIATDELRVVPDPRAILRRFEPTGERYVIAAQIAGPAKSAFPDGAPAAPAGGEAQPKPAHIAEAADIAVLLVADSDIFDDRFWVQISNVLGQRVAQPTSGNGAFVLNAVDAYSGSTDLIALRSRGVTNRPFEVVEELRRRAEERFLAEEEALQQRLEQAEARIRELQEGRGADGGAALSPEQEAEVQRFRAELIQTRAQLREVQRNLSAEIDALGTTLAAINIGLVPVLVLVAAFFFRRRRAQRRAAS